jgi:hypothetical protein
MFSVACTSALKLFFGGSGVKNFSLEGEKLGLTL